MKECNLSDKMEATKQMRKCSECGVEGHNKRTCKVETLSIEEMLKKAVEEFVRSNQLTELPWEVETMEPEDALASVVITKTYTNTWKDIFTTEKTSEAYVKKLKKQMEKVFKSNDIETDEDDHVYAKKYGIVVSVYEKSVTTGLDKKAMEAMEAIVKKYGNVTSEYNKKSTEFTMLIDMGSSMEKANKVRKMGNVIEELNKSCDREYYISGKMGKDGIRIKVCEWK